MDKSPPAHNMPNLQLVRWYQKKWKKVPLILLLLNSSERRSINTNYNFKESFPTPSSRKEISTSQLISQTAKEIKSWTPISSIFVWQFVMLMASGLLKIGQGKTLWKGKRKFKCTMEKAHSLRFTQGMSVGAILREKSTLLFIQRPQCWNFPVMLQWWKK